ncbi:TPM domain-containing protein [Aquimarina gracilis]|uniref:TPM domain-containing protein n=1 Tax=Aquimarina gracilis TaxID=874422 RepID=A0ABU5ZV44_9FLAO|nr:TPM domain-containing protein [Aquimarina gracilis]MEB3345437.1 TPM domain-containing protein [Aquimarina gracilis]
MKNTTQHILSSFFLIGIFFISIPQTFAQRDIPAKPKEQTAVYDDASMLSGSEAKRLEQKLIRYSDTTSTQVVVATITSLQGENIGLYAAEWAHKWGIGQEKEDNGVFILVAKNDRKIWIATGYGVEEKLTDFVSKTIIDQIITPEFKLGRFYSGLDQGTNAIFEVLQGTFKGSRKKAPKDIPIGQIIFLIIFFIIIIKAFSKSNHGNGGRGNRGRRSGSGSLLDVIILSNMGRGSYGGGSFGGGSSGGFGGGFGGGGFGGGGAGGSW